MNNTPSIPPKVAKYTSSRIFVLLIAACSVIDLVQAALGNGSVIFSSYLSRWIFEAGLGLTSMPLKVLVCALGVVSIAPYVVCWLLSRKHVGWMIGALGLFAVDTVPYLLHTVPPALAGDYAVILDMAIRVVAFVYIGLGIKHGLDLAKEKKDQ